MRCHNLLTVILIVSILALAGCSNTAITGEVVREQTYAFGGPANINMLGIIAKDMGIFDKYGIKAERVDILTGKMAMDALINGNIDFGILVDSNIAFINFQGDPGIEVIAIVVDKSDDSIVGLKDKISSAEDLRGKRIGITKGTTSHVFAVSYLKDRGIDISEVEFVNMPPPSIQAAVINGNLDAGSLWQPFKYNVEKTRGDEVISLNDRDVYVARIFIAVRKDFAKQNPEAVEAFLRSLIEVEEHYKSDAKEFREKMAEELEMPLEIIDVIWDEYDFHVHMDRDVLDTVEAEAEWIVELEEYKGKQIPDYESSFNPNFLQKIDPERVNWD